MLLSVCSKGFFVVKHIRLNCRIYDRIILVYGIRPNIEKGRKSGRNIVYSCQNYEQHAAAMNNIIKALFLQFCVPIYGWRSIRNHDRKLHKSHWNLKVVLFISLYKINFLGILDQEKNPKWPVSSYFHSSFSPISRENEEGGRFFILFIYLF